MIDLIQILHTVYNSPVFWLTPVTIIGLWFALELVGMLWLIIDDRFGRDLNVITKGTLWLIASVSSDRKSMYRSLTINFNEGAMFLLEFWVIVIFPVLFYAFPLTIILILLYSIVVGLRFVRRTQKRINNVPTKGVNDV